MPEANSALILSNPPCRYPQIAPEPAQKPKLLGHNNVRTRMICIHVLTVGRQAFVAPWMGCTKRGIRRARIRRRDKSCEGCK